MNKIFKTATVLTINLATIFGMGNQPPPPPPPFIGLDVTSAPYQAPLFLIDTNSVTCSAQLSFYSPSSVDGEISFEGTKTIRLSESNAKNFNWEIPQLSMGAGISFKIWKTQELFAAFKIDNRRNSFKLSNLDFGIGFLINEKANIRARLDFGLSFISTDVSAKYLYIDPYNGDSSYTSTDTNDKSINFFVSATIQAAFEDWIINPFLQASYCPYTFLSIERYNKEVYFTSGAFTIAPGISFKISNNILLIAGGSIFILSNIENLSPPNLFSGFLQGNFLL